MTIKVLIVDDHKMARQGLALLLSKPPVQVIGDVSSGAEALIAIQKLNPDMMLLDVQMPEMDGLRVLGKIRASGSQLKVLMLSSRNHPAHFSQALALGANGYMLKSISHVELLAAIHRIAAESD